MTCSELVKGLSLRFENLARFHTKNSDSPTAAASSPLPPPLTTQRQFFQIVSCNLRNDVLEKGLFRFARNSMLLFKLKQLTNCIKTRPVTRWVHLKYLKIQIKLHRWLKVFQKLYTIKMFPGNIFIIYIF